MFQATVFYIFGTILNVALNFTLYLLFLQHPGKRPDSGGGWDQSGGGHSTVCSYSFEKH